MFCPTINNVCIIISSHRDGPNNNIILLSLPQLLRTYANVTK